MIQLLKILFKNIFVTPCSHEPTSVHEGCLPTYGGCINNQTVDFIENLVHTIKSIETNYKDMNGYIIFFPTSCAMWRYAHFPLALS